MRAADAAMGIETVVKSPVSHTLQARHCWQVALARTACVVAAMSNLPFRIPSDLSRPPTICVKSANLALTASGYWKGDGAEPLASTKQAAALLAALASDENTALTFPANFASLPLSRRPYGTLSLSVPSEAR